MKDGKEAIPQVEEMRPEVLGRQRNDVPVFSEAEGEGCAWGGPQLHLRVPQGPPGPSASSSFVFLLIHSANGIPVFWGGGPCAEPHPSLRAPYPRPRSSPSDAGDRGSRPAPVMPAAIRAAVAFTAG